MRFELDGAKQEPTTTIRLVQNSTGTVDVKSRFNGNREYGILRFNNDGTISLWAGVDKDSGWKIATSLHGEEVVKVTDRVA